MTRTRRINEVIFWNVRVRGIIKPARRRQIKEYIYELHLDYVGLQETKKQDFTDRELAEIGGNCSFTWIWVPAQGLSGGILVGIKTDIMEMEDVKIGHYSIATTLIHRVSNFRWIQVTVYGPAHHDASRDFLEEITEICHHDDSFSI